MNVKSMLTAIRDVVNALRPLSQNDRDDVITTAREMLDGDIHSLEDVAADLNLEFKARTGTRYNTANGSYGSRGGREWGTGEYGKSLYRRMRRAGMRPLSLAAAAHVSDSSIYNYLNGKTRPQKEIERRINAALKGDEVSVPPKSNKSNSAIGSRHARITHLNRERLRACRIQRDMSQSELADAIGASQRTVSHWECNGRSDDVSMIRKAERVLGTRLVTNGMNGKH